MSKKILGLDLGTTSIGWAFVIEAEKEGEISTIEKVGVRVNPLTTDEQTDFEKGKPLSVNADRTLKRGARRNLQRYKQRRKNLIDCLQKNNVLSSESILGENDANTTHETYAIRGKAATAEVSKEQFARVLLMINKKRGYKSSRKAKNEDEGMAIDGMAIAKKLYEEKLTPGQLCYQLLKDGKSLLPDFYRSDLQEELNAIWSFQQPFHPNILTDAFKKEIEGKGQRATSAIFWTTYQFNTAEKKGTREEKKLLDYEWRSKAINTPLSKEELASVITEINNNLHSASGYLGAISDRSKELYFDKKTIGQYQYDQLKADPHTRMKNQVFYRQDYLDEFEIIWETQAKYHKELTPELKTEIRDIIIFYQRKLKSQKGLVSFCEFESKKITIQKNNKPVTKTIGYKVAPKSSPLFQEFKIWQNLGNLIIKNKLEKETSIFDFDAKKMLFEELNMKGNLPPKRVLEIVGYSEKEYELNFKTIEGNRTNKALYQAYLDILELEGYDVKELLKLPKDKDEVTLDELRVHPAEIKKMVADIFGTLNINTAILDFDAELKGKLFEQQPAYQLWHLLYSYQEDNSPTGNETLYRLLASKFGFAKEHAKILAKVDLLEDYGSLSAKAMRELMPHIKKQKYDKACEEAGYNHSSYLTKEEIESRPLKDRLELLPKNSLRNPVVEKILNQMVNVINAIIDDPALGKPDEIRIELARKLKSNAEERKEMTDRINKGKSDHDGFRKILAHEFGVKNPTRNDIIRYKLYNELKINGFKTLYSNTYIPREKLFSKEFDIEHIIPKALLFNDSFSNKTICARQENLDKSNATAMDFVLSKYNKDQIDQYLARVHTMHNSKEDGISKAKHKNLLMKASEIGDGFIERDLRDTQYIAKKAKDMLYQVCRRVVSTSGSITSKLREDWGLVNIMQELNFDKYKKLGLTETIEKKDGSLKERITDWTKRNDHRHHAMDALTVAFTKHNHIQYLNFLNARKKEEHKMHGITIAIEAKETELIIDNDGRKKRKFKQPMPDFREEAKKHLEATLVSYKTKNKVVTKNINKFKTKTGEKTKIELTPRGQLHKETVYGRLKQYSTKEEKVGSKFDESTIQKVASAKYRNALLERLKEHGGDPKKAFSGKNSLDKTPVFLDAAHKEKVPEKVKLVWLEDDYTIRKDVGPDLKIEKVIDIGIRNLLQKRLDDFNGNPKEAFANLDKNPIWQNKEKGIAIKRVTISGVKNADALHVKKDHLGKKILDTHGYEIPVDFVSTGNNHHVAIYRDAEGALQEKVVSFYEAVERVNQGLPVIDKLFNHTIGWQFLFTMKQNECFVFPSETFNPAETDLLNPANNKLVSANLYRVQKLTIKNYWFRHHLETSVEDKKELIGIAYKSQLGLKGIEGIIKVKINHIGQIVKVGEY
jgi:CRISPR-associated endonuclease Csn1